MAGQVGARRSDPRRRTRAAALATAVASVVLLAGCSAAGLGTADSSGAMPPVSVHDSVSSAEAGSLAADGVPWVAGSVDEEIAPDHDIALDRSVITTGWATITSDEPLDAANAAIRIVERVGGRIDGRYESSATEFHSASASIVARIPSARLQATLDEIRELGRADYVSLDASDVTTQVQDIDARVRALTSSIDRLLELYTGAESTEDLIRIEVAISDRQADLESLQAQQRYLADQVSLSTISIEFRSEDVAPAPEPGSFWDGLVTGWGAFLAFWGGFVVVLGVLTPWLILLAIVALVLTLLVRRRRRARRARTQAPGAASARDRVTADRDDDPAPAEK